MYLKYSGPNNVSVAAVQSFDSLQAEAVAALLDSFVSNQSAVHPIETKVSKKLDRNRRGVVRCWLARTSLAKMRKTHL